MNFKWLLLALCSQDTTKITYSFIQLACSECDHNLSLSGASPIPLLYTLSFHPFPPTILPSSLASSCHLFLGLPLYLVSKFIYNILLRIQSSSILCTCPNQHNIFNLIVSVMLGFLIIAYISLLVNILQYAYSLSHTGPKILLYTFLSKWHIKVTI